MSRSTWKRPDSVPVPTVWRRHVGFLEMPDGKKPKFIIQDLSDEYVDEVVDLLSERLCRDEAMFGSLKIVEDPVSMKEVRDVWRKLAKDKAALVALVDDGSAHHRVAGANLTFVCRKQDKYSPDDFNGRAMKAMARDGMVYVGGYINIFEKYGVTEYLSALGLIVHPDYRGQGLGVEILKARVDLGKAIELKVSMTFFTTLEGQKAARKAGFELLGELPYAMFKSEDGTDAYPNIHPKTLHIMALKLE